MNIQQATNDVLHVAAKTLPATSPGFVTITLAWLDVLDKALSVTFLALSILFLLWRWHVARRNESPKTE